VVEEAIGSASVVIDQEIHVHQGEEEAEEDLTPADLTAQTEAEDAVPAEEEGEATHQEEDTLIEATLTSQEIEETERIQETLEILKAAEM